MPLRVLYYEKNGGTDGQQFVVIAADGDAWVRHRLLNNSPTAYLTRDRYRRVTPLKRAGV